MTDPFVRHLLIGGSLLLAFWSYSALVDAMNPPARSTGAYAFWYRSAHLLAGNINRWAAVKFGLPAPRE